MTAVVKKPAPSRSRFWRRLSVILVLLAGLGVSTGVMTGHLPNYFASSPTPAVKLAVEALKMPVVKVVQPKRDATVALKVDQLATIEPYYRAELRARASGLVKQVYFEIGDKVRKDDVLLEIEVPETEQDVARCEALILQRQQELKVSEAKWKDSQAARLVSAATIKQREAEVAGVTATRDLKKRKYERYQQLAAKGSVVGSLVEEEERDYLASEAQVMSAKANVERARADLAEADSKVEAALADIELKKAQIEVTRRELDRAKAVADYARIRAPFDGVVVRRNVDPGSFVQNATTGSSEPLISLARVDIVTVVAKFPDNVAPSVEVGTPATVQVDDLPGVTIPAKVTRFAPSVQNTDRTIRVEIDLFNGSPEEYRRLESSMLSGTTTASARGPSVPQLTKTMRETLPVRAFHPEASPTRRLLPGMTATVQLALGRFGESFVLPSSAVYTRSGVSYILLVEKGKTRQVQVRVQLNDGKTVLLAMVAKRKDADGVQREVLQDLTGKEEVVVSRQLEIGHGATVTSSRSDW